MVFDSSYKFGLADVNRFDRCCQITHNCIRLRTNNTKKYCFLVSSSVEVIPFAKKNNSDLS